MADEAVAIARRLGDDRCLLEVGLASQVACTVPDRVPRQVEELPELIALAERVGDVEQIARVCFSGSHHSHEMDRMELGERLRARVEQLGSELKSPVFNWMIAHQRCRILTITGSGDEIERSAVEALHAGEVSGQPDRLVWFAAQIFQARWAQGRLAETVPSVRAAIAQNPDLSAWRATLPLGLAANGEREEAAGAVAELMADPAGSGPSDIVWLVGQSLRAEAVAALGTTGQATRMYETLAPYAGRIPCLVNAARPGVDMWLAMLAARAGQLDLAERHFSSVREQHRRLAAPVWLARTELEWGRLLAERGERERAQSLLASARAGAARVRSVDVEAAAGELLERLADRLAGPTTP